jgi:predicted MPP superfamily phosphohydrolase
MMLISTELDDIEKAASVIPKNAFSVLLSHTPEVYDQAAAAEFDLMLSGHTHGGELCLPGGIPIKLEGRTASINGRGHVASCGDDWLYVGRHRYKADAGPSELPAPRRTE